MTKLRESLAKRGSNTVRGLGLCFRCLDSYDGNRKVDKEEFRVGMNEIGVNLTNAEADALMTYFDTDHDGTMNFDEFLVGVRVRIHLFNLGKTKRTKARNNR